MDTVQTNPAASEPRAAYQLVGTGTEWVVDAAGCRVKLLRDLGLIQSICERVIADIGVKVVGDPQCHRFDGPGGVTTLYLLSESHLACHTYPEYGLATFNLYCCRERAAWDWQGRLSEALGAQQVDVRQLSRGLSVFQDTAVSRQALGGLSASQQGGSSQQGGYGFSDRGQG